MISEKCDGQNHVTNSVASRHTNWCMDSEPVTLRDQGWKANLKYINIFDVCPSLSPTLMGGVKWIKWFEVKMYSINPTHRTE